jgi:hypothetical protein
VVTEVPVTLGDMAMPGRPLLTVYDPSALRISANLPQSLTASLRSPTSLQAEIAGLVQPVTAIRFQVLPAADASSHTLQLRLDLPRLAGVVPGMFARVLLPAVAGEAAALTVPNSAVVRRAEMTGVYVLDGQGRALLRQVRLGRVRGSQVEVLSGISSGERIALEPQAAARSH